MNGGARHQVVEKFGYKMVCEWVSTEIVAKEGVITPLVAGAAGRLRFVVDEEYEEWRWNEERNK